MGRISKLAYNGEFDKQIGLIMRDNGREVVFESPGNQLRARDFVEYDIDDKRRAVNIVKIKYKG